jgi:hypothetical protein
MGGKRKNEDSRSVKVEKQEKSKTSPAKKKSKKHHHSDYDDSDMDDDHHDIKLDPSVELNESAMPSKEILCKLLDRIEAQLPKEDHVKYDSRYEITSEFFTRDIFLIYKEIL